MTGATVGKLPSHRTVWFNLVTAIAETAALIGAAVFTGSVAMRAQAVTSLANISGGVFLLIGVVSSVRPADDRHPLGYGRERFFWSFVAAIGIFVGGFGATVVETISGLRTPEPAGSYTVGYLVLGVVIVFETLSLIVSMRPMLTSARARQLLLTTLLWRGTDPAVTTVVLSSAAGSLGAVIALLGLGAREFTANADFDAMASGLIAGLLLLTSLVLLHTNRELLTGRGIPVSQVELLREIVLGQRGVLAVPHLFAIIVGPGTLLVEGDVIFEDSLEIGSVEAGIVAAAAALRASLPAVTYVYLNPVAAKRTRQLHTAATTPAVATSVAAVASQARAATD